MPAETITTKTTTLLIERPQTFEELAAPYQLVRYELPDRFRFVPNRYARLHIALKQQLQVPYHLFTHDHLSESGAEKTAVYALFRRAETPVTLSLDFLQEGELSWRAIRFEQLKFHNVIKLLQMDYARIARDAFTAIGNYYVHAKGESGTVTCLQIAIKGDRNNREEQPVQRFKVTGQATRLRRRLKEGLSEHYKYIDPFFRRDVREGQLIYTQLLPEEIDSYQGEIFGIFRQPGERASLDFHSDIEPEHTRGKLLYDFTHNFIRYLGQRGIGARHSEREFMQFEPATDSFTLPIGKLGCIYIYDHRYQREVQTEQYRLLLERHFPNLRFEQLVELESDLDHPVLILQDFEKKDFDKEGIFGGRQDPYQAVYSDPDLVGLPKQTINVNPNHAMGTTSVDDYLFYELDNGSSFLRQLTVSLDELCMKALVLQRRSVQAFLPTTVGSATGQAKALADYTFVRQTTYAGGRYGVLMWIEEDLLHFADIRHSSGRTKLEQQLEKLGLDRHEDILGRFKQKHRKVDKEESELFFDFVIGSGFVAEIEDVNEHVLYEYDEILRRRREPLDPAPLASFQLALHYDRLKRASWPSLAELEDEAHQKQTKAGQEARQLLAQLRLYDEFLADLGRHYIQISLNELLSPDRQEELGALFAVSPDQVVGKLKRYYRRLDRFQSSKSRDLLALHQSIWYDHEWTYMVGSPHSLNQRQATAHLLRQFDVYFGGERFEIASLLDMMSVPFVRHKQYTVYPFPFHLIDIYVENKLQYED